MSGPVGRTVGTGVGVRRAPSGGRRLAAAPMVCAAFTVLLGVLLMHSVPMVHPPTGHTMASASTTTVFHPEGGAGHHADVDELTAAVATGSDVVLEMGCGDDCSPHIGMAMCMAVISVVAALLVTRQLLALRPADDGTRNHTHCRGKHSSRAPPWTTPSLEKLSVLRI